MRYFFMGRDVGFMTAVGLFGWFSGSLYEKYKIQKKEYIPNFPGLPVFGTVSAATPFSEKSDLTNKLVAVQNRTAEIMKYGFPGMDNVRSYDDFVLSFDRRTRVANWVFEHLTAERVKYNEKIDRALCDFTEDTSVHKYFRKDEKDGNTYVKYQVIGENQVAVPNSFFKVIVMETKDNKLHMEAYVMPNEVIPDNVPLSQFLVPPDAVERAAGLLFFDRLSREKLVQINGKKTTYI